MTQILDIDHHKEENTWLWRRFRAGDPEALGQLANLHYQALYSYGSRFSRDSQLIQDCIQDVFLYLWEKKETISDTDHVKPYLFKSLRHRIAHENTRVDRFRFPDDLPFQKADFPDTAEARLIQSEIEEQQVAQVSQAISGLSKRQQELIFLKFYLGFSSDEILEIMHIERPSLYNLLSKALKEIRAKLVSSRTCYGLLTLLNFHCF